MVSTLMNAFLSGAAGAIALNFIHECSRKAVPDAPRMDIIGMRAMSKLSRAAGLEPPRNLRTATLGADVVANTLYYSAAALGGPNHAIALGTVLGVAGGIGGVLLPGPLGLGNSEANRKWSTQIMVVGMYAMAGVLAGLFYKHLAQSER
jgi:hypothetical protein